MCQRFFSLFFKKLSDVCFIKSNTTMKTLANLCGGGKMKGGEMRITKNLHHY